MHFLCIYDCLTSIMHFINEMITVPCLLHPMLDVQQCEVEDTSSFVHNSLESSPSWYSKQLKLDSNPEIRRLPVREKNGNPHQPPPKLVGGHRELSRPVHLNKYSFQVLKSRFGSILMLWYWFIQIITRWPWWGAGGQRGIRIPVFFLHREGGQCIDLFCSQVLAIEKCMVFGGESARKCLAPR